jgi:hypothetical protein
LFFVLFSLLLCDLLLLEVGKEKEHDGVIGELEIGEASGQNALPQRDTRGVQKTQPELNHLKIRQHRLEKEEEV